MNKDYLIKDCMLLKKDIESNICFDLCTYCIGLSNRSWTPPELDYLSDEELKRICMNCKNFRDE